MAVSIPPVLKRYSIPLFLFTLGLFFQIVVLPSSFSPTHYAVLGVKAHASVQEVTEAYEKLSAKWFSDSTPPTTIEFIKIRFAYEMLTNPVWKRDYDLFGIDEQLHVIEKLKKQYDGVDSSKIELPLLNASISDLANHGFNVLSPEEFVSITGKGKAVLIQVYSAGSPRCAQFLNSWKRIANLLEGVAETGMVELGDVQVAAYLAEKKYTGQPFFRNGLPALVAFPPNCRSGDCYVRLPISWQRLVNIRFGPRESKKAMMYSDTGRLNCNVSYTTFSTPTRGQGSDHKEYSSMLHKALEGAIILETFPKTTVDVFALVLESGGSDLPVIISCASLALADAGIMMYDLVSSVSVSCFGNNLVIDPTAEEEACQDGSLMIACMPARYEVTQLTLTGEWSTAKINEAMELCLDACLKLANIMRSCLKEIAS